MSPLEPGKVLGTPLQLLPVTSILPCPLVFSGASPSSVWPQTCWFCRLEAMDKIKLQEPQVYFWVVARETPEMLSGTGHLRSSFQCPQKMSAVTTLCCEQSHPRQRLEKHGSNL